MLDQTSLAHLMPPELRTRHILLGKDRAAYAFGLACAFLLGAGLRLYHLKDQLFLDDEWHGLFFIRNRSLPEILTQMNPFNNSSPLLNIYGFICYHLGGVSEWNLRLPLLVTGCALPVLCALLVRRKVPLRAGIIFSFLLALSPFLIFYSRFSRSYILVALLSFTGLIYAFRWITGNRTADAAVFVLAGTLAVYAHPSAAAITAAPYAALAIVWLLRRLGVQASFCGAHAVRVKNVLTVLLVHLTLIAAATFNYFINRGSLPINTKAAGGWDIPGILRLAGGTAGAPELAALAALACFGFWRLYKSDGFFALLLAAAITANIFFILLLSPACISNSAVFLRYCIAIIPILLLCAANGTHQAIAALQNRLPTPFLRRYLPAVLIAVLVLDLYAKGPLPEIYRMPNNFTGHLAFQGSYKYDWEKSRPDNFFPLPSRQISAQDMPVFYKWLETDPKPGTIIEYPFNFDNQTDQYYFYQLYHHKRVMAGYWKGLEGINASVTSEGARIIREKRLEIEVARPEGYFSSPDIVKRSHFRNMVDISDRAALRASRADLLLLHKFITFSYPDKGGIGHLYLQEGSVSHLKEVLAGFLGAPAYEDDELVVFSLATIRHEQVLLSGVARLAQH